MIKYLDMVKELEQAGYVTGQNVDGTFYWSTYTAKAEGFNTEEAATKNAWVHYDESLYYGELND